MCFFRFSEKKLMRHGVVVTDRRMRRGVRKESIHFPMIPNLVELSMVVG